MTREQALRKVMACLRLSTSSNPHEAASALRQAKALMAKYGLTEADAASAEIFCADAPTRGRGAMVPDSVLFLADLIAAGYRCQVLIRRLTDGYGRGSTRIEFYGLRSDVQVSAYAFTVLRRQMETDKTRRTRRYKSPARRKQAGELFAMGWLAAVRELFPREELSEALALAVRSAIEKQQPMTGASSASRPTLSSRREDLKLQLDGYLAGKNARLRRGVTGPEPPALELIEAEVA